MMTFADLTETSDGAAAEAGGEPQHRGPDW